MKPFSQSERRQGVDASRRIRLVLKCFHGRRSRVGFNGRLRGFWWIISGGTGGKKKEASPPPWRSVVTGCMRLSRCEEPRQRGSVTRLHGGICAVYRQSDRRLVVRERSRVVHWTSYRGSTDVSRIRDWPHGSGRTPKEILSRAFLSNGPRRPPAASAGRCGHVTPCIEPRRIIISWPCLATEVSFIVIFFPLQVLQGGRVFRDGREV